MREDRRYEPTMVMVPCVHRNVKGSMGVVGTPPLPDARSRAEQPELERSYVAVSPPLPGMLHIPLVYIRAFALVSHVSVATVFSLYEDEGWPVGRESCLFVQLVIGSRL